MNLSLRRTALAAIALPDVHEKARLVRGLSASELALDTHEILAEPPGIPGRPARPVLVAPSALQSRAVGTREGRAGLLHALAHIEANAINLALDLVWRFAGMPEAFYRAWFGVAQEEALHFQLLSRHLEEAGFRYGDFPAHDGLWETAHRTREDLLARLALVPRTLEARGLDASPAIRKKLVSVGDLRGGEILDIILRDEIGHVALGNRWFRYLCAQGGHSPVPTYARLADQYQAAKLKGPFNLPARRAAGFDEAELEALQG
jgi:uncharacterized ferritin-like protein (DUF455 family)